MPGAQCARFSPAPTAARRALRVAVAGLALSLAGCDAPAPRSEAPLASGVVTLPAPASQRFDAEMSADGLLAAFGASAPLLAVEAIGEDAALLIAHLPRRTFEARILGIGVEPLAILQDGYALVVGSGFVSVYSPVQPLGLLQLDGRLESALTPHGYTRIVGVRRGELGIIGRGDYHAGLFESAMQVGPGIIQQGALDIRRRERALPAYIRAFVAVCADRYLAGVALRPMHLYDVGERLLGYFDAEALVCSEVANLAGDREALLAARATDGRSIAYFGNPALPKASVIAFRALEAAP